MVPSRCGWPLIFLVAAGVSAAIENYIDYENDASNGADKAANLRELYKMLMQRQVAEGDLGELLSFSREHLQPRSVERSPNLRLRFGRSYSKYPRSPSLRLRFGRSYSNQVDPRTRASGGGGGGSGDSIIAVTTKGISE